MSRIVFRIIVNQKLATTNQSVITVTTDSDSLSFTIPFIAVAEIMGVFFIVCLAIIGFFVKKQRKVDAFKDCMDL